MEPETVVAIIAALLGLGGAAFGVNQQQKRKGEQASYSARLKQIDTDLAQKERQLASLRNSLDEKNEQVRALAAEIDRLRSAATELRRRK